MKKYLFTIFFFLFVYNLQSQVLIALLLGDKLNTGKIEFGLDGGFNFSTISGFEANKWNQDWNLGFYFDFNLKEHWALSTGVLVKGNLGVQELTLADLEYLNSPILIYVDEENEDESYTQSIGYFIVPVLAKYKLKNNLFFELGPQVSWMHNASIEYKYKVNGVTLEVKDDNENDVSRIDFGFTAGVGYRLLKGYGWTIGARYYQGVTNVYRNLSGHKNSALFLKLYVPIGVSDEKKKVIKEYKEANKERKAQKKEAKKIKKETEKENNSEI